MSNENSTPIIISGSLAYDSIMVYHGKFRDQIMTDKMHILNLVFMVPTMRREYGGCAGNIAYSLQQLGSNPHILAMAGKDFAPYMEHLRKENINVEGVLINDDEFTAQAFIITDEDDNQIIAFHPGAMQMAERCPIPASGNDDSTAKWGIVSPNGKQAMQTHMQQLSHNGIKAIFDPGQGLPMFSGEELNELITFANAVIVNDYELQLLCEKTNHSEDSLAKFVKNLIVTLGGKGCKVWQAGEVVEINAIAVKEVVDPTGCGDTFRAGLLHGLNQGLSWIESAKLGNVVAGIKVESPGPQNHRLEWNIIKKRYQAHYSNECPAC